MTVVEFIDPEMLNNLIGCLTIKPQKVIFLGDSSTVERVRDKYVGLIRRFGLSTEIEFRNADRRSVDNIIDVLSDIIENENDEISFNLNGGDDLVLVAMGIVFQSYKGERHIDMHRFNVSSGKVVDCDGDEETPEYEPLKLSVDESLSIYGGRLKNYSAGEGTYPWDYDEEFLSDISVLWDICREDPKLWNLQISTLGIFSSENPDDENELRVHAKASHMKTLKQSKEASYRWNEQFLKRLINLGYLQDYKEADDFYSFRYKNEQIKMCLAKAGTILELKVYQSLNEINNTRKQSFFNDAVTGACIDWDNSADEKDVENEIDVMVMKGVVPIFISCKNGKVEIEELYKLNSVAQHFGGSFSRKFLVVTNYGEPRRSGDNDAEIKKMDSHIRIVQKRAEDMGIKNIDGVHLLDDSDFKKAMRDIVC